MDATDNKSDHIYNEAVCGLATEAAKSRSDSACGCRQACDGHFKRLAGIRRDDKRKPGKRNGCIGNW